MLRSQPITGGAGGAMLRAIIGSRTKLLPHEQLDDIPFGTSEEYDGQPADPVSGRGSHIDARDDLR